MRNILKSSLLLLALSTASVFAQAPAGHKANPDHQAKEMSKKLGLTPDQTSQIAPILLDRQKRIDTLTANTSLDTKAQHQQRRAIMTDTEQKLNAILTPAQQQQFATMKANRHHGKSDAAPTPPPTA